uniref:Ig-like domain-containing protein n=1 Tax=Suricata suricatta TaxID=37032 RepID=A0A673TR51_SURSU
MLLLQLVLFTVLVPDVDSDNDSPEPISFRTILTTSFYNRSWTENQGSIWLDELQTHGWDSKTGAFIFLRPWSKGNFSTEELVECGKSFHTFSVRFPLVFQDHVSQWELELRPEAWLSRGPSPGPGCLLLVCHVSGFYPKPVWVMWMRGEQKQQGAQQGDILPHETAGLSCQVRHSSLGGQDMVLYWKQHRPMGLVFLVVMVPLVLLAGLALWLWKRW